MSTHLVGDSALLIDTHDTHSAQQLRAILLQQSLRGLRELVPAYNTLLLEFDVHEFDVAKFIKQLPNLLNASPQPELVKEHEFIVRYDGEDLEEVAKITGLDIDEVIQCHCTPIYTVAFLGYAPGFPYLVGLDNRLQVPRLETPRTRVPAGAVAIAGEFSGIYPRATPGGWRLLGCSDAILFDPYRPSPALLAPGDKVHFRALT
jgi:KipI family sensor histidine kinase inhibitor